MAPEPGRASFGALGTTAVVLVTDAGALDRAVDTTRHVLERIDAACSRFRPDSDLERVNAAGGRPTPVGPQLLDALEVALDAARWTDGVVDPTIGSALRALGYDRDFTAVPTVGPAVLTLERVPGWQAVVLDRAGGTVTVPPGVRLDLGATAKALAADLAASDAAATSGCGVLVSLGGDLAIAGDPPEGGWAVMVTDDHLDGRVPDRDSEVVELDGGGLATSSTTVRQWQRGEQDLHHIVDPATGTPAEVVWRTVSVAARTCVDANVAATASIVLGAAAPAWLERHGLPSRLVAPDGRTVRVSGWPEEDGR